jgi:hypothetical protein
MEIRIIKRLAKEIEIVGRGVRDDCWKLKDAKAICEELFNKYRNNYGELSYKDEIGDLILTALSDVLDASIKHRKKTLIELLECAFDKIQIAIEFIETKPRKAYKLFRTLKTKPGLFPLFIGKTKPTPQNEWIKAEMIPTKGFAVRPGWHAGVLPIAPHLRTKDNKKQAGRVWCEVEISSDINYQTEADNNKTKDIRNKIPENGYYEFKTNKMQGGAWIIAGAIKITKVLSDNDIEEILSSAGYDETEIKAEQGA